MNADEYTIEFLRSASSSKFKDFSESVESVLQGLGAGNHNSKAACLKIASLLKDEIDLIAQKVLVHRHDWRD